MCQGTSGRENTAKKLSGKTLTTVQRPELFVAGWPASERRMFSQNYRTGFVCGDFVRLQYKWLPAVQSSFREVTAGQYAAKMGHDSDVT